MISRLYIKNFKAIGEETFELRPLTIFTGLNSTGKSSCLQAILAVLQHLSPAAGYLLQECELDFAHIRNRNVNAKTVEVELTDSDGDSLGVVVNDGLAEVHGETPYPMEAEKNVYYLNANRSAYDNLEKVSGQYKSGIKGEFLFGTFEEEKSNEVIPALRVVKDSDTLSSQVDYWLGYILGMELEMSSQKVTSQQVQVLYKSGLLDQLSPRQLGVGVSSLAKILIMCLRAEKGDVVMVENPAIHLHPAAQSRLAQFFVYIANAGIQLIVETHCEHLLNRLQYETFKGNLKRDDMAIYYKASVNDNFLRIRVNDRYRFEPDFPTGFFDATLDELLEME